jgi:hypothetical protein
VNKNGTIIVLDNSSENGDLLCKSLARLGHKNKTLCFDDAGAAGHYLRENLTDVFLLLQNSTSPGVHVPDTRNMVYMHEKFKTDTIPYMFLVLAKDRLPAGLHTFVHCYYKPAAINELTETLANVVNFWKDHVFPPRVNQFQP